MRNTHFSNLRPPIAIKMSLIAAWRQEKEREKVPLPNIDSRFISFGEHAAVRAPVQAQFAEEELRAPAISSHAFYSKEQVSFGGISS